ncbi:hypothetical protein ACFQYP_64810 [Nonomuraea antimicrobica]
MHAKLRSERCRLSRYYQLHELEEIVSLADLREMEEDAGEETA